MVCSSSLQPQANPNNSYAHLHIEVFALQSCVHGWHIGMHGCDVWCRLHVWVCVTPLYCLPLHCHCLHHITVIRRHIAISTYPPLLSVTSRAAVEYSAQHVAGCNNMIITPGMCPHREREGMCKSNTVGSLCRTISSFSPLPKLLHKCTGNANKFGLCQPQ